MKEFNYFEDENGRPVEPVFEMATVDPDKHKLGVALKINIPQPGDKMFPHGPRIKFFKNKNISFSISVNKDPGKIEWVDGDYTKLVSLRTLNRLIEQVKKYRVAFLNMWHDPAMSQDDLLAQMKAIDEGEAVRLKKPHSFA